MCVFCTFIYFYIALWKRQGFEQINPGSLFVHPFCFLTCCCFLMCCFPKTTHSSTHRFQHPKKPSHEAKDSWRSWGQLLGGSSLLVTPVYKPYRPFGRGTSPQLGDLGSPWFFLPHIQVLGWSSKYSVTFFGSVWLDLQARPNSPQFRCWICGSRLTDTDPNPFGITLED